jgi:hypothetical protein
LPDEKKIKSAPTLRYPTRLGQWKRGGEPAGCLGRSPAGSAGVAKNASMSPIIDTSNRRRDG